MASLHSRDQRELVYRVGDVQIFSSFFVLIAGLHEYGVLTNFNGFKSFISTKSSVSNF